MSKTRIGLIVLVLAAVFLFQGALAAPWDILNDGEYRGTAPGMWGDIGVSVVIANGYITSVEVTEGRDGLYIYDDQLEEFIASILAAQSLNVDVVTGASVDCGAIMAAIYQALQGQEPKAPWWFLEDGQYHGTAPGMWGDIGVTIIIAGGYITGLEVTGGRDDLYIYDDQLEEFIGSILAEQSLHVDVVTGASVDCEAILAAIYNGLQTQE